MRPDAGNDGTGIAGVGGTGELATAAAVASGAEARLGLDDATGSTTGPWSSNAAMTTRPTTIGAATTDAARRDGAARIGRSGGGVSGGSATGCPLFPRLRDPLSLAKRVACCQQDEGAITPDARLSQDLHHVAVEDGMVATHALAIEAG